MKEPACGQPELGSPARSPDIAAVGFLKVLPPRRRPSYGAPPSSGGCGAAGAVPTAEQAERLSRAGQRRSAAASPPGAMGQDLLWLNHSGSPRAAAKVCAVDGQRGGPFAAATAALLAALMGLLVLAMVLGNALVILALVVDRSLRTQSNIFFLNLAVADLLVGEFRGAGRGGGWRSAALHVSPPSSVRRLLLHPLHAEGQVETRQGLV